MKIPLCLMLIALGPLAVPAADTAYSALRVVGKQNGADSLNHVVEVRGRAGAPEPQVWKILLTDATARGGLREVEVQHGKIIAERTPTAREVGRPINFNQLNLDSEGAFTVVNQEAQKVPVTFDRIDYVLQAGRKGPQWHLELFDRGAGVGSMEIAADSGNIIGRDLAAHRTPAPKVAPSDDRAYLSDRRGPPPPPEDARVYRRDDYRRDDYRRDDYRRDYREDYDRDDYYDRDNRSFAERVENHFERRAHQIKRFFLGD